MAKTKTGISKKARKSIVLRIMNILFFLALIAGITIAVLMFTPVAHDVKLLVKSWGWSEGFTASLNKWVRWHVVPNFQLPLRWNHHSVTFTSCLYIFLMCSGALIGFYLMYIPFLIMYRLKLKGKTQVWRKFVFWFAILITFCLFASIMLNFWRQRIARDLDWAYPVRLSQKSLVTLLLGPLSTLSLSISLSMMSYLFLPLLVQPRKLFLPLSRMTLMKSKKKKKSKNLSMNLSLLPSW